MFLRWTRARCRCVVRSKTCMEFSRGPPRRDISPVVGRRACHRSRLVPEIRGKREPTWRLVLALSVISDSSPPCFISVAVFRFSMYPVCISDFISCVKYQLESCGQSFLRGNLMASGPDLLSSEQMVLHGVRLSGTDKVGGRACLTLPRANTRTTLEAHQCAIVASQNALGR